MTSSVTSALHEEDWDSLVYSVKRSRCILMLGPDAATLASGESRTPVIADLAGYLRRKLEDENPYVEADYPDAAAVAQAVVTHFRGERQTLIEWVTDYYKNRTIDDPMLTDLAALPFELVVNTAPGIAIAIEEAFEREKPDHNIAYYDYLGKKSDLVAEWSAEAPLLYHLFGSLTQPESIPISDTDLLDYLVSVIRDDPPLPENLASAFRESDTSFLFLGFRLHEWRLRILMHVLDKASRRKSRSFALEGGGFVDEGTQHFYQSGHRIYFFDMRVADFVSQLRTRVDSGEGARLAAMAVAPDAPSVFLCHASEDKVFADDLATRLEARGIRTWLDKNNLRGGSEWDGVIERTVERDVAYFVVLQSERLKNKRQQRAYVNKEIKLALKVQDQYVDPRRFLFPIFIDDEANRLPGLDHLQSIDMTPSNDSVGFEALVSELHRDMERERKQSS